MNRGWKALTSAALAAALVLAPMVATGALADEEVPPGDTVLVEETTPVAEAPAAEPVAEPVVEPVVESVVEEPAPPAESPTISAPVEQPVAEAPAEAPVEVAPVTGDHGGGQPDFICTESGAGWQAKVDTTGDPATVTVTAPEGFLIDAYCVKAGLTKFIIDVEPPAATVVIDHPLKGSVSHYQVHLIPVPVVVPTTTLSGPQVKDLCETENDHYGLPANTEHVTYTRGTGEQFKDIIATVADGYTVPVVPAGWVKEGSVYRYAFNAEQFTDVNCEEEVPVPALYNAEPTPPTCETAGTLSVTPGLFEHVTIGISPEYTGPGMYTITADTEEGYEFPDGSTHKERVITVLGAIGFQSEDPEAPCFLSTPPTPEAPEFVDECGVDQDGYFLPEDTEDWFYTVDVDGDTITVQAVTDDQEVIDSWTFTFTDEPCPVTPPVVTPPAPADSVTPPKTTTPSTSLASTGGPDMTLWAAGSLVTLIAGLGLTVARRVRAQR